MINTTTLKRLSARFSGISFALIFILCLQTDLNAQSQGYYNPGTSTYENFGCISCAGTEWTDFSNITVYNSTYAEVSLMQTPFCFQTSCFWSRGLIARDFSFFIPFNSVITGIEAEVSMFADSAFYVKDSSVVLLKTAGPGLGSKSSGMFLPDLNTYFTYGDSADMWGDTWTPSEINDPSFGVMVRLINFAPTIQKAFVDHMQLRIHYAFPTGETGSQVRSSVPFRAFLNKEKSVITVSGWTEKGIQNPVLRITDMSGKILSVNTTREIRSGKFQIEIPVTGNLSGINLVTITGGDKMFSTRLPVVH